MKIGICDDDFLWREKAADTIGEYAKTMFHDMELYTYANGEELLSYDGESLDILFMDIELKNGNGIDAVKTINERWPDCQTVYLTNYLFYATEVYQTKHTYFVLKEELETRIEEVFKKLIHIWEQRTTRLLFHKTGGGDLLLAPSEIMYIE